ncbi:MAG: Hint domain-containing protein [Pseudorhodobacter sp.]
MPTNYSFAFYVLDPGNPPAQNARFSPVTLTVTDQNDDGFIRITGGDTIGGFTVTNVWVGDTITVRNTRNGADYTITGVTFYRAGAPAVFMPTDGTVLQNNIFFRSSTFVTTSTEYQVGPVPCFVAGTLIETDRGQRRIEDLRPGDLVMTRDNGLQPLRWIGQTTVPGLGEHASIRFMAGAMGNDRALEISPNHRMLVEGWKAELYFGEEEVLVAAKHLVNGDTILRVPRAEVTYLHLLFARHEVIFAEGAAAESLHPGDLILKGEGQTAREILALFPELGDRTGRSLRRAARPIPLGREARVLCAA